MRVVLFCHSLASCWNHGNAHFLRGVARELLARGHHVRALEADDGWSRQNLLADRGETGLNAWRVAYPELHATVYGGAPDLDAALDGADLVLVHEWSPPALVVALGRRRALGGRFQLLFHDTHHRTVTASDSIGVRLLDGYDGVLAFGACLRDSYRADGWASRVWVWHEAADTSLFRPQPQHSSADELIWIGNWGDDERSEELRRFLIEPVQRLSLRAAVHGVRYPEPARDELGAAGIDYRGWLPNHEVPAVLARARVTVHVPRRPYVEALPGIPTIRVFEALACGIPLVSAPWRDEERLFPAGAFLRAANGEQMARHLRAVLDDDALRREMIATGLHAIRSRHSCAHRVDELLAIHGQLSCQRPQELRPCA